MRSLGLLSDLLLLVIVITNELLIVSGERQNDTDTKNVSYLSSDAKSQALVKNMVAESLTVFMADYSSVRVEGLLTSSVGLAYVINELVLVSQRMTFNLSAGPFDNEPTTYFEPGPIFVVMDQLSEFAWKTFRRAANDAERLKRSMDNLGQTIEHLFKHIFERKTESSGAVSTDSIDAMASIGKQAASAISNVEAIIGGLSGIGEFLHQIRLAASLTVGDFGSAAATYERLLAQKTISASILKRKEEILRQAVNDLQDRLTEEVQRLEQLREDLPKEIKPDRAADREIQIGRLKSFPMTAKSTIREVAVDVPEFAEMAKSLEQIDADDNLFAGVSSLEMQLNQTLSTIQNDPDIFENNPPLINSNVGKITALLQNVSISGAKSGYFRFFKGQLTAINETLANGEESQVSRKALVEILSKVAQLLAKAQAEATAEFHGEKTKTVLISGAPAKIKFENHRLIVEALLAVTKWRRERAEATQTDIKSLSSAMASLESKSISVSDTLSCIQTIMQLLANTTNQWRELMWELRTLEPFITALPSLATAIEVLVEDLVGDENLDLSTEVGLMESFLAISLHTTSTAFLADSFVNVFRYYALRELADLTVVARTHTRKQNDLLLQRMEIASFWTQTEVTRICHNDAKVLKDKVRKRIEKWSYNLAMLVEVKQFDEVAGDVDYLGNATGDVITRLKACYADEALLANLPAALVQIGQLFLVAAAKPVKMSQQNDSVWYLSSSVQNVWDGIDMALQQFDRNMRTTYRALANVPKAIRSILRGLHTSGKQLSARHIRWGIDAITSAFVESSNASSSTAAAVLAAFQKVNQLAIQMPSLKERLQEHLEELSAQTATFQNWMSADKKMLDRANSTLRAKANETREMRAKFEAAQKDADDAVELMHKLRLYNKMKTAYEIIFREATDLLEGENPMTDTILQAYEHATGVVVHGRLPPSNDVQVFHAPERFSAFVLREVVKFVSGLIANENVKDKSSVKEVLMVVGAFSKAMLAVLAPISSSHVLEEVKRLVSDFNSAAVSAMAQSPEHAYCGVTTDKTASSNVPGCLTDLVQAELKRVIKNLADEVAKINLTLQQQKEAVYAEFERENDDDDPPYCKTTDEYAAPVEFGQLLVEAMFTIDATLHQFNVFAQNVREAETIDQVESLLANETNEKVEIIKQVLIGGIKCPGEFRSKSRRIQEQAADLLTKTVSKRLHRIMEAAKRQLDAFRRSPFSNWAITSMERISTVNSNALQYLRGVAALFIDPADLPKLDLEQPGLTSDENELPQFQIAATQLGLYLKAIQREDGAFRDFLTRFDTYEQTIAESAKLELEMADDEKVHAIILAASRQISQLQIQASGFSTYVDTVGLIASFMTSDLQMYVGQITKDPTTLTNRSRADLTQHLANIKWMSAAVEKTARDYVAFYGRHLRELSNVVTTLAGETKDARKQQRRFAELTQLAERATRFIKTSANESYSAASGIIQQQIEAEKKKLRRMRL